MLEFKDVCVRQGRAEVIKGVSLCVPDGRVTVLLGKNGSGKSTLLRAASGAIAYSGMIAADGADLYKMVPAARARCVARMPQVLPLPDITVNELAARGRAPYLGFGGSCSAADRDKIAAAMEHAGVTALSDRRVSTLSGGERQRAFFAMLMAQDAPNVLLDEPTANLDSEYRQALLRDVRRMRGEGRAVLIVMHHLSEAAELADQICVLNGGRIVFSGDPAAFAASGVPERVFSMQALRAQTEDGRTLRVFKSLHPDC